MALAHPKASIISAVLGVLSVIASIAFIKARLIRYLRNLDEFVDANLPLDAGTYSNLEFPDFFEIKDDPVVVALLLVGIFLAASAIALGFFSPRKSGTDYYRLAGFSFGWLALLWNGSMALGVF